MSEFTSEQKKRIDELRSLGKPIDDIARMLGLRRRAVRDYCNQNVWFNKRSETEQNDPVALERERARRRAEVAEMKRLVEKRAVIEEWRDAIRQAALSVEPPPLWPTAKECGPGDEETAVLVLSDVHLGQHTPGRINAGWTQTVEVVEQQFVNLSKAVIRIWELQNRAMPWRELVILDLGDDVEGDSLHTSQHRMVDPLVAQQTAAYGRLLAGFVQTVLQVFEKVKIERVPGNHGRTSPKPGNAGLAELDPADSYDWLAGEFTRAILKPSIDQGRVVINNHESYWAKTDVQGHRIIFEHGSSLRGGNSWGGIPYYGIDRAAASYRDLEGDYLVLAFGHYHRPYVLPSGYGGIVVGNGSFSPTTPFVAATKHHATRPSQTLLSLHPRRGVTMIRHLYLDTKRD